MSIQTFFYWLEGKNKKLSTELTHFFGSDSKQLPIINRTFSLADLPNLQLAITQYAESQGAASRFIGYNGQSLRDVIYDSNYVHYRVGPIRYRDVDVDVDQRMQCMENAVYLIDLPDGKIAAHVVFNWQRRQLELEVMATTADWGAKFIEDVRQRVSKSSVYRGKIISLESDVDEDSGPGWFNVRFHRFPPIRREEIILSDETMALIERNVVSFFQHADVLRRSGRSVKRGLLFHGKPGTGKTYTAKCLAQTLEGVTTLLLSGEQLWLLKECCQMARMLAPSLVIMEDVDLIATAREQSVHQTVLHQLLNEMDGMTSNAEVIFLLTTNRPEVIEPAISERPGRIDQAIKFPLPDAECRRQLFELYGRGLRIDLKDFDRLITKTDEASPAFIQELVRKAALIAAEENSLHDGTLRVTDEHFDLALRELVLGGDLTRNMLGFRQGQR
jgi:hypothetical protein